MKTPDFQHNVQPWSDSVVPSDGNSSCSVDAMLQNEQRQRMIVAGAAFGMFVGLPMGAVTGAACCWLTGSFDFLWHGIWIGSVAGPCGGGLVGFVERQIRGHLARPDIAVIIGILFGLLPALVIGVQGLGGVRGNVSGRALLGAIFAGPMIGLVIGGMLDRAFESYLRKLWRAALGFAGAAVAICIGIVWLIDGLAYGPDPKEVSRQTRGLLVSEFKKRPGRDATVHKLDLTRSGRTTYTGMADVTLAGQRERLVLEVRVEGTMLEVTWTVEPHLE